MDDSLNLIYATCPYQAISRISEKSQFPRCQNSHSMALLDLDNLLNKSARKTPKTPMKYQGASVEEGIKDNHSSTTQKFILNVEGVSCSKTNDSGFLRYCIFSRF